MPRITYIGRFTPPTGGVTAKNKAIYEELREKIDIQKIDLTSAKKGKVSVVLKCFNALFFEKNPLIIGTAAQMRRSFTHVLYLFNRKTMNRSVLMVMGGQFGKKVAKDKKYQNWLKGYKQLYVETDGMIKDLNAVGIQNVSLFPNCRKRPTCELSAQTGKPSCVFFSLIQPQKGVDNALDAAMKLPDIQFHFYGGIDSDYKDHFLKRIAEIPNAVYHGVFSGSSDEVYSELNKYDILLFPTKWAIEGVPGILVEAKIAGLVPVVSDMSYNAELVHDKTDGIVLDENSPEKLAGAVRELIESPATLNSMRIESKKSAERFYFDNNIQKVMDTLGGGVNPDLIPIRLVDEKHRLKCVFFSMIRPEKGVDLVLETAQKQSDVDFEFWGVIDSSYENTFLNQVSAIDNCTYKGVFQGKNDDVYKLLNSFDVFLFPTRWVGEGVPGALIEAKIAGIPAIVSDWAYNSELVTDSYDGYVMREYSADAIINGIQMLKDKSMLLEMKRNAKQSGEKYFFESYTMKLLDTMQ